jgi:hypothetical protein
MASTRDGKAMASVTDVSMGVEPCRRISLGGQTNTSGGANPCEVVEAAAPGQSLSALRRHLVFNQADDASDNRTGKATADRLAGESTDVNIVALR